MASEEDLWDEYMEMLYEEMGKLEDLENTIEDDFYEIEDELPSYDRDDTNDFTEIWQYI